MVGNLERQVVRLHVNAGILIASHGLCVNVRDSASLCISATLPMCIEANRARSCKFLTTRNGLALAASPELTYCVSRRE
jgi:hypothetical protein